MMKKFKRALFGGWPVVGFFLVVGSILFLATKTLPAEGKKLNVNLDYATFRYDSVKTYMELYYSFNGSGVRFVKTDSMFSGLLLFQVAVNPVNLDTLVNRQMWKVPLNVTDTSANSLNNSMVGEFTMALAPGKYNLSVKVNDENDSTNVDSIAEVIEIPSYLADKLCMSDIELCSSIASSEESGTHGLFYKNTYDVIPNPTAVFGVGLPIVYYYFEVYNIAERKPNDSTFTVGYQIRDSFGNVYKNYTKTRKKFGSSSVEVGTVNASNLRTGSYTIVFTVTDSGANSFASSSKRFFVYNPNLGAPLTPSANLAGSAVLSSAFATMGEEQLDDEFSEAKYIATSGEISQYKQLHGVEAKRQFMYEFWKKRENVEQYNVSDERSAYLQRVNYANDHFRSGYKPGWKTDRGRVYIIYGNPDEIDRHPNETDVKPYEIWYYNSLEGGVSFDFIDKTGFGDYQLVNSTERNEIHDDNWQQYLNVTN
jgi:GWxTD domain-containing protein